MDDNAKEPYTRIPNILFDAIPHMSTAELRVVLAVARKTCGWHKQRDTISLTQLEQLTGLTRANVIRGVRDAARHKWLNHYKQGRNSVYELTLADGIAAIPNDTGAEIAHGITAIPEMVLQQYQSGITAIPEVVSQQYTQKKPKERRKKGKENSSRAARGEVVESVIDHSLGDESAAINPPQEDDPFAFIPGVDDKPAVAEQKEKPAEKRQRKSKATLTPEEAQRHAELFEGIVRVCVVDAKLCGGHIARTAKQLREADPAADGAAMDAFLEWWKTSDFRGKQGKPPTIAQIAPAWKMFREGYAEINRSHVGSKSNDSVIDRIMRSVSFLGENNGN